MAKKNAPQLRLVDQAAESAHDVVTQLHERAAQVEDEFRQAASAVSGGSEQGTTVQLTDLEGTVRRVVSYMEENPFAAVALAAGAGAMLTSMYWDQFAGMRAERKASRRPVATAARARPAKAARVKAPKAKAPKAKARRARPPKAARAKAPKVKARKAKARPKKKK